jgi:hypothetical protein
MSMTGRQKRPGLLCGFGFDEPLLHAGHKHGGMKVFRLGDGLTLRAVAAMSGSGKRII